MNDVYDNMRNLSEFDYLMNEDVSTLSSYFNKDIKKVDEFYIN
jgi:hypothetical protein